MKTATSRKSDRTRNTSSQMVHFGIEKQRQTVECKLPSQTWISSDRPYLLYLCTHTVSTNVSDTLAFSFTS